MVHSRCARSRAAGLRRPAPGRSRRLPRRTPAAFHSFSQNTTRAIESPPSLAARYCSIVAAGPYRLTWCCQRTGTDRPKPGRSPAGRAAWPGRGCARAARAGRRRRSRARRSSPPAAAPPARRPRRGRDQDQPDRPPGPVPGGHQPATTPPWRAAPPATAPRTRRFRARARAVRQGGPKAGTGTGGYIQSCRTSDAPTMIRIAPPMPDPASQPSSRTGPASAGAAIGAWTGRFTRTESVMVPYPGVGHRGARSAARAPNTRCLDSESEREVPGPEDR